MTNMNLSVKNRQKKSIMIFIAEANVFLTTKKITRNNYTPWHNLFKHVMEHHNIHNVPQKIFRQNNQTNKYLK